MTEALLAALDATFKPIEVIAHRAQLGSFMLRDEVMGCLNRLARQKRCARLNIGGRVHFKKIAEGA
jgi:hypothetical protein